MDLQRRPAGASIWDSSGLIYIQCVMQYEAICRISLMAAFVVTGKNGQLRVTITSLGHQSPHLGLNQPLGQTRVCSRDARLSGLLLLTHVIMFIRGYFQAIY